MAATVRGVAATPRATPQMTVAMPDLLRRQAQFIAEKRDERDLVGHGFSVVLRKAARAYVRRHRDLLPPELRD